MGGHDVIDATCSLLPPNPRRAVNDIEKTSRCAWRHVSPACH
jgi:hypothetical protein